MKRLLFIMLTALIGVGYAQAERRYEVHVGDFTDLRVVNSIGVSYYCNPDSAGIIIVDATDHPDYFWFENNEKGKLSIQTSSDYPPGEPLANLIVYSSKLEEVVNSGDSIVTVHSTVPVEKFTARIIGNGTLTVANIEADEIKGSIDSGHGDLTIVGKARKAGFRSVGKGKINALNVIADEVKASIVGTGSVYCNPQSVLTIVGAGTGNVFYLNEPPKIKNRSIAVKHSVLPADKL